jgi:hypothetical protein
MYQKARPHQFHIPSSERPGECKLSALETGFSSIRTSDLRVLHKGLNRVQYPGIGIAAHADASHKNVSNKIVPLRTGLLSRIVADDEQTADASPRLTKREVFRDRLDKKARSLCHYQVGEMDVELT